MNDLAFKAPSGAVASRSRFWQRPQSDLWTWSSEMLRRIAPTSSGSRASSMRPPGRASPPFAQRIACPRYRVNSNRQAADRTTTMCVGGQQMLVGDLGQQLTYTSEVMTDEVYLFGETFGVRAVSYGNRPALALQHVRHFRKPSAISGYRSP